VEEIRIMTEGHVKFAINDIMAKKGSVLLKQVSNRIDYFFTLA